MGVGPRVVLGTVLLVMLILPGLSEAASDLRFGKIASLTSVDPGDNLTWTLWVDNVGADPAQRLWVNESLPPAVAYVGDNAATAFGAALAGPPSISGGFARYEVTRVAPGDHSFHIFTPLLPPPPSTSFSPGPPRRPTTGTTRACPFRQSSGRRAPSSASPT